MYVHVRMYKCVCIYACHVCMYAYMHMQMYMIQCVLMCDCNMCIIYMYIFDVYMCMYV